MAGALPAAVKSLRWQWILAMAFPILAIQIHQPLVRIPDRADQAAIDQLSACQDVWGTQDYRPQWSEAAFWASTKSPQPSPKAPVLPACDGRPVFDPPNGNHLRDYRASGTDFVIEYASNEGASLEVPIFYYPAWRVEIDGRPADVTAEPITGLIEVKVPPGDHSVQGHLGRTPAQTIGGILTVLGILLILGWFGAWVRESARSV